jgi:hypothetical protein
MARITINRFGDHAPEGKEIFWVPVVEVDLRIMNGQFSGKYQVAKRDVANHCVRLGLMTQAENQAPQVFPADD